MKSFVLKFVSVLNGFCDGYYASRSISAISRNPILINVIVAHAAKLAARQFGTKGLY